MARKKYVVGVDLGCKGSKSFASICNLKNSGIIEVIEIRRYKTNNIKRIAGYIRRKYSKCTVFYDK